MKNIKNISMQFYITFSFVFSLAYIIYTTRPFAVFFMSGDTNYLNNTDMQLSLTIITRMLYLLIGIMTWLNFKAIYQTLRRYWSIIAWLAYLLVSLIYQDVASVTSIRIMSLIINILFCIYFANTYGIEKQIDIWKLALSVVLGFSIIFIVFVPEIATSHNSVTGTAWLGIFSLGKNGFSKVALLFWIICLVYTNQTRMSYGAWAGLLVTTILILMSQSVTGIFAMGFLFFFFLIMKIMNESTSKWKFVFIIFLLSMTWLLMVGFWHYEFILDIFNRDISWSGRFKFWPTMLEILGAQLWLGYGFESFWENSNTGYIYLINTVSWKQILAAHNGFLELCLGTGLIGFVLFMISFAQAIRWSWIYLKSNSTFTRYWPIMSLAYLIVINMTESMLIRSNYFTLILYFTLYYSLGKWHYTMNPNKR